MAESLDEYERNRDFDRTAEPEGGRQAASKRPIFVIQRHEASRLHYDFRLEMGRVLKSWAVPKGPPQDPHDRRLALPTEDHPLEYATFAGEIPPGSYGAGSVAIWDSGTYQNLRGSEGISITEALVEGKIEVRLDGRKLSGNYALIRTDDEEDERWLWIRMKDQTGE